LYSRKNPSPFQYYNIFQNRNISFIRGTHTRYIPQSFVLTFVSGPLAWISTIALVLSESAALITIIARTFLLGEALTDTFDLVLLTAGKNQLVQNGRELTSDNSSPMARLGSLAKKPLSKLSIQPLIRYLFRLPLNFIPVVGTAVFLMVQGREMGPAMHDRYFALKGYTEAQREEFLKRNKAGYMIFGAVCTLLQMVPLANVLFLYTNVVGAALWAVELERKGVMAPGKQGVSNGKVDSKQEL
jgi:uncharacterized protein involved in cysteine biosynthesis